jgi:hypothetical protein
MEPFPWTRLENTKLPRDQKPMTDLEKVSHSSFGNGLADRLRFAAEMEWSSGQ